MRPVLRFLTDDLADRIIDEARGLLCELGMKIRNTSALELLSDHGAQVDLAAQHVRFSSDLIDNALKTAPPSFTLFNAHNPPRQIAQHTMIRIAVIIKFNLII